MDSDWKETKQILKELEVLFTQEDDLCDIGDIKKMCNEIEQQSGNVIDDAQELMKRKTMDVANKETEILAAPESVHEATVFQMNSLNQSIDAEIDGYREQADQARHNILKDSQSIIEVQEKLTRLQETTVSVDKRTAYALSLYGKISNISWDYDCSPDVLAGCIGNNQTKDLLPFSFNKTGMSSYDSTNQLWNMIEESYNLPAE